MAPRFFLSPDQINEAQADIWAQGQREQLADDWAAQAIARLAPAPVPAQPDLSSIGSWAAPQEAQQHPLAPTAPEAAPFSNGPVAPPTQSPAAWSAPPPAVSPEAPSPAHPVLPTASAPPAMAPPPQRPDETISNPFGEAFRQLGTTVSAVQNAISPPPLTSAPAVSSPSQSTSATPMPTGALVDYARQAAAKAGIDPDLFVRQINQESHFDPTAGSSAGARGIAQIVPKYHPGVDPSDPYASLDYAANLMKSHLTTYGGDIKKALVAYNGGGGAVNAMDSGHIYGESQDYLNKILGGGEPTPGGQVAAPPPGVATDNLSLSQFGDKTLSADEAYAACGPAAAARLAAMYGNAIPLSVALQAAKQAALWTSGGGMNGIAAEKKLMDALGLPAELDTSGNTDRILSEAGQGRMVTISTPGHYFSASGTRQRADGQTELYVGQSGADLKNGRPWMTIGEIEGVMGTIQGALYSDSSKAVAAGDWMQRAASDHGIPLEQPEHALGDLAKAREKAGLPPPAPDETVTNPFGEAFRQIGNVAGGARDAVGGAFDALGTAVNPQQTASPAMAAPGQGFDPSHMTPAVAPGQDVPLAQDARDSTVAPQPTVFDQVGAASAQGQSTGDPNIPFGGHTPFDLATDALRGPAEAFANSGLNAARQEYFPNITEPKHPVNVATELNAKYQDRSDPLNLRIRERMTPEDQKRYDETQLAFGGIEMGGGAEAGVAGKAVKPLAEQAANLAGRTREGLSLGQRLSGVGREVGDVVPATQGGTANNTLLNMFGKVKTEDPAAIPGRVEEARRFLVRKVTDRGIDLAEFQKDAQRAVGRPLTADEMVYEMRRLNPSGAADMRIQNELKPAIQSVGKDADWLKVYLTHQDNIDVGRAMGNAERNFSGRLSAADSKAGLLEMEVQLGPERMAKIDQAAQQIHNYGKALLQRKVDSGLISQSLFDELTTKYPNYSPTRIVDFMKDPVGIPSGRKISVQSAGLKRNTVEGTTRQREDPLASFVRLAHETEALATKNEVAQAFLKLRELNPDTRMMIRKVADDVSSPRGYEKMKVFENGVPQSYQMPSYIAKAIKEEPVAPIPLLTPLMNLFRMAATQRNPLFLASNALNDSVAYTLRTSSRMGGPQNVPKIAAELVKAYGDTFQGLFSGEFSGDTARYLKGGGSQSGFFSHSAEDAAKVSEALQRPHVFAIRSDHVVKDLSRLIGQALTLKPIEAIGERIELAPRVAAMRLAEKSGSTAQQAVLAGRTVTIDFSTGGTWVKTLNQVIPFFNVAWQAGAQLPRAYLENPRGFVTTAIGTLAAPTVAIEAWNRSDPQRAKDYADVPQYVKDAGLVFMLPTPAQTDERGNRKPQYMFLPTREYSPFVTVTREAASRAMGADPRNWAELVYGTSKSISPVSGNSGADMFSTGVPLGVSTALQLSTDQDWYRGGKILSKTGDEQASAFSKVASDALNKMGMETRPSAIEFAARDVGAGVGGMALAASDMVAGRARKDERVQSTPGVGGLVGRFLQDKTGERLTRTIDEPVKPAVKKLLADAGIPEPTVPYEISVRNEITGKNSPPMELRQAERVEYTRLMNVYLNDKLQQMQNDPGWASRPIESRNKILEARVKAAREYAERTIDAAMDRADRAKRMQAGREKQMPVAR